MTDVTAPYSSAGFLFLFFFCPALVIIYYLFESERNDSANWRASARCCLTSYTLLIYTGTGSTRNLTMMNCGNQTKKTKLTKQQSGRKKFPLIKICFVFFLCDRCGTCLTWKGFPGRERYFKVCLIILSQLNQCHIHG